MADISEVIVIEKKEDGTIVTTTTYDIKDEIAREQLNAIPDGTYPDMTVGGVMSTDGSTDSTPYLYRASGGGVEVGTVEEDSIVGGTVAWNQLMNKENYSATVTKNGVTFTDNGDGTVSVSGTATANTAYTLAQSIPIPAGHKMLVCGVPQGGTTNSYRLSWIGASGGSTGATGGIFSVDSGRTDITWVQIVVLNGVAITGTVKFVPQIFDLTQMFGSTIADYIYSLEQSSTGAGVAFFRKLFPKDYYEYNSGELMSVEGLQSHDMVGKNLIDLSGTFTTTQAALTYLPEGIYYVYIFNDADIGAFNSFIQYKDGSSYVNFDTDVTHDIGYVDATMEYNRKKCKLTLKKPCTIIQKIQINTASSGHYFAVMITTDGTGYDSIANVPPYSLLNEIYEPYIKHSYPLDSSLKLRGIPKLDANNNLYYDGDTYEADGTVTRKYGVVDLGTQTWGYDSTNNFFPTSMGIVKTGTVGTPIICSKYVARPYGYNGSYSDEDKIIWVHSGSGTLRVRDSSYTDAATFKSAMSGVMLVYELATPTTESAEPYESIQKVSKYGTEEYVSTGIVPVGHVTKYPTDIVAKVNGLPSDFSTLIAPTESGFKATRAYSVNQFIIVDNQLYRVTSAIASGATITVGTNVTATTVADILTTLLNA